MEFPELIKKPNIIEAVRFTCTSYSMANEEHPTINQDAILENLKYGAFGILDGLGGHARGDVASATGRDYINTHLSEVPSWVNVKEAEIALLKIAKQADKNIYEKSIKNEEYFTMGTTLSMLKIHTDHEGKNWIVVAHVGDSRICEIGADNKLRQLTIDDNKLRTYKYPPEERDRISKKIANAKTMEELKNDPNPELLKHFYERGVVTKWIGDGFESTNIDVFSIPVNKGNRFVIMSDGIYENLITEEIEEIISQGGNIAKNLVEKAAARSKEKSSLGKIRRPRPDDMSVVVVEIN